MIITISGSPGSGKSSIGRAIARMINCQFYSAGDVWRKFAAERGMTINELGKMAQEDPATDRLVDDYMKSLDKSEENMVIDGRLAWLFIPSSIKIYVDADLTERARRILKDKRSNEPYEDIRHAIAAIKERVAVDQLRYSKLYGVDPYDAKHYDLILDTTDKTIEQAVGEAYRFIMFKLNQLNC